MVLALRSINPLKSIRKEVDVKSIYSLYYGAVDILCGKILLHAVDDDPAQLPSKIFELKKDDVDPLHQVLNASYTYKSVEKSLQEV